MDTENFSDAALSAWLHALPMGQVGEMARQVYQMLGDLVDADLPATVRWRALARILPVIDGTLGALERRYTQLCRGGDDEQVAHLAQSFHQRIEQIALRVATDPQRGLRIRARSQRAYAVALRHQGYRALIDYQRYTAPSAELWQDIAQAFDWSGGRQRASKEVYRAYLAVLCTAAANPLRFSPTEMKVLYQHLLDLKLDRYVSLQTRTVKGDRETWVVNRDGLHFNAEVEDADDGAIPGEVLELKDLIAAWPSLIGQGHFNNATLLRCVSGGWCGRGRSACRYAVEGDTKVSMVIGFDAVYRSIAGDQTQAPAGYSAAREDLWNSDGNGFGSQFDEEAPFAEVHVMDHSEEGYRLRTKQRAADGGKGRAVPVIGDLIALEFAPGQWIPGFVRWLKQEAGGLDVGVRIAGQDAQVASIHRKVEGEVRILVTSDASGAAALIETRHKDRVKRGNRVVVPGSQEPIVLTDQTSEAGNQAVMVFGLERVPTRTPIAQPKKEEEVIRVPVGDEFAGVWNAL